MTYVIFLVFSIDRFVRSCLGWLFFVSLFFTVAVVCQNGDLRLVNGSVSWVGRIEICWNEVWGTICDRSWGQFEANVACRQLGYAAIGKNE